MENVISKYSRDDMLVMYRGEEVELIVPLAERAIEIYMNRREFVMSPEQAQGYLLSIIALSKEFAPFAAEIEAQMQKDPEAQDDSTYLKPLRAALLAIQMSTSLSKSTIQDALRVMLKEAYLATSRYTIDSDFRVQAIPQQGNHGVAS